MDKKEELLINAAQIIYEEGIQKLTMDYLAKKSNLTKGGVLYHFQSKGKLLEKMNEMAINKFEQLLQSYMDHMTGSYRFTRAYAEATLYYLNNRKTALLPAVFISSLEDQNSFQLWKKTSRSWEQRFLEDEGDPKKILQLRLMCDGIWFELLYGTDYKYQTEMKNVVLELCETLEKGEG